MGCQQSKRHGGSSYGEAGASAQDVKFELQKESIARLEKPAGDIVPCVEGLASGGFACGTSSGHLCRYGENGAYEGSQKLFSKTLNRLCNAGDLLACAGADAT